MATIDELLEQFDAESSSNEASVDYGNDEYSGGETYQSNSSEESTSSNEPEKSAKSIDDLLNEYNTHSEQQAAQQANGGQSYVQTAVQDVTGQPAQAPAQQQKPGIFEKPEVKTTPERDALIEQLKQTPYDSSEYAGWATDEMSAAQIQDFSKRNEILEKLRAIDQELGNGEMDYTALDRAGSVFSNANYQIASGLTNAAGTVTRGIGEAINSATGGEKGQKVMDVGTAMQNMSDNMSAAAQQDVERAKNGLSRFGQAGVDIATNVIQMGFDAAVGAATGGGSLASMFLRSAGNSMQQARNEGASTAQQLLYGGVSGGIEVLTEKIADGVAGIYGKGAADDITESLIRKLSDSDFGRSALRLISGAVSEGGEEVLSDLLQPYAELIYNGKGLGETAKGMFTGDTYDASEMLYDFIIGATIGALGGGTSVITGQNANANAQLREADAIQNNLTQNNGMNEADARKSADILAKVGRGEEITKKQSAFLDSVQEANGGLDTSKPGAPAPQAEAPYSYQNEIQKSIDYYDNKINETNAELEELRSGEGNEEEIVELERELAAYQRLRDENAAKMETAKQPVPERQEYQREAPQETDEDSTDITDETPAEQPVAEMPEEQPTSNPEPENPTIPETPQESPEAPSSELNSEPETEGPTAEELEAAEREANAPEEAPPKGWEKTLRDAQQKTEDAQKKAAQQPAPEQPKPLRKIKPYTENEKILAADRTRLDRENKSLRNRVKNLEKQTKRTDVKTARESDVRNLTRDIIKRAKSEADLADNSAKMQKLADYIIQHTGETIDYAEVQRMAEDIAYDIVDNRYEYVEGDKEIGDSIRELARTTSVNIGEIAAQFSLEDAKTEFPFMKKFAKTKGISIQDFYDTLVRDGYVPANVNGAREQLQKIKEVLEDTEDSKFKLFTNDGDFDQAVTETTNDIIDAVLSDAVRESEPTFADKAAARLDAEKARGQQRVEEEKAKGQERLEKQKGKTDAAQRRYEEEKAARRADRQASRDRMEQMRKDASQKKREAIAKEKAAKYKDTQKLREHFEKRIERDANKRKTKKQRDQIRKLYNELSDRVIHGNEKSYVPKELMNAAVDLLNSIDTDTGSVNSAEKLNKLRAALNEVKHDPNYSVIATDDVYQAMLDELQETVGGTPLNEMSSDQLTRVYKTMKKFTDAVRKSVKVKISGEEHQAAEIARQATEEIKQAKGWGKGVFGALNAWYTGAFGRGTTYFERLAGFKKDSVNSQLGNGLNEGQRKATAEKVRAAVKFSQLLTDKAEKTLRETVKLGKDASGKDIEVSRGMMLSLKMLLDSKDGARHIKYGGLTIPGISDYYKGKNDSGFGTSHSRALGISPELAKAQAEYREIAEEYKKIDAEENKDAKWEKKIDDVVSRLDAKEAEIDGIIGKGESYIDSLKSEIEKQLTDYDRKWIKTAREYFDEAQVMLNDTTMDVYGFKKANVADYFPLVTDPNFRKANFESIARDMSLENSGFMKSRVNSGNPILLLDISEVIANYSDKVASYTGLMPAIRDFQKVYGKTEAGFATSLQEELDNKFGKSASKYIEDLIADLQGARRTSNSPLGKWLSERRGAMAQAVLSMNPRVAFSQSASYMNAASEIGWQPLTKALSMGKGPMSDAKVMDLITKYSPLMYYRTLGNSNAAMTDIQGNAKWQNQMLKKFDFVMGWINAVDQRTVGRLWYASEAYVQQQGTDYAKGTDEYYEEVAKVFNRVVEKTQPNYTTMQRAGILREPNELVKSMTMFMTQRLQNQNILYEAGERLAKYESDFKDGKNGVTEADVKKARKDMFNAVSSQIMSTATLVAFKGAIDAVMHNMKRYRDDDDELNAKSISAKLGSDFADSLIGNLLGGTEIYSLYNGLFKDARYDGITVNGISTISDTLKDIASARNAKPEKQLDKTWKVVEDVSKLFGIPLENAEKFVDAVWKHAQDVVNGNLGTFDSDLSEGPIDKMTKVDFGYKPVTNMFSPLYNAITQTSTSKDVAKEIQMPYESTGIAGVYPNIRGVNKITVDGEDYDLTGKEGQKYHETAGKAAEQFAKNLMDSKAYKAMSDDQKAQALKTLYSYAKDLAKDEFIADLGIKTDTVTTATSLLKGLDKAGTSNDKTALNEKNLADYVSYTTLLKSNINDGNYKDIDKLVSWYDGMDKNMKTVLKERNTDLKRLLEYKDVGEGSESYFKMKESIIKSQINLDQNANTSAYVRLYAVADCDLPESSKRNIVRNLMQGDDNFISKAGRTAFNTLSEYGMTVAQVAQFFDIAMHCASYKDTGDDKDFKGKLTPENTAYALSQVPWFNDSQRTAIYNKIKAESDNDFKVNDWGNYTYASEVKWFANAKNKATYGTDVQILDKREYQTSNALWNAYVGNAS